MAGGSTVFVNFDALTQLVTRLENIQGTFDSMGPHPWVDASALGDSGLAGELEQFLDGWSQGRQQISGSLASVVKAVLHALTTYETADRDVASAEGGTGNSGAHGTAGPANG